MIYAPCPALPPTLTLESHCVSLPQVRAHMKKVFTLVGSTAGGSIGWAAGATIGTMTGFFLMVIGTAAGTYYGIKAAERFLP